MNKPLARRLWIVAATLLVLQGGAFFLLQRARSSEVRPLHRDLSDLPFDIVTKDGNKESDWQGKDQILDEELTKTVGARQSIGRFYQNAAGQGISVHMADWDSLQHPTLPHPPSICYVASGGKIISREPIEIAAKEPIKAELMVVERGGVRTLALYWYSWNELVCTTRTEACCGSSQDGRQQPVAARGESAVGHAVHPQPGRGTQETDAVCRGNSGIDQRPVRRTACHSSHLGKPRSSLHISRDLEHLENLIMTKYVPASDLDAHGGIGMKPISNDPLGRIATLRSLVPGLNKGHSDAGLGVRSFLAAGGWPSGVVQSDLLVRVPASLWF